MGWKSQHSFIDRYDQKSLAGKPIRQNKWEAAAQVSSALLRLVGVRIHGLIPTLDIHEQLGRFDLI